MKRKIHYKSGKVISMPLSGSHSFFVCGKSQQDNYESIGTKKWKYVTCKNCLKHNDK